MRNLTKTLAVVSILAPASAHPLGIGDIKLHSALNQNLNAEIALMLSGEKPSDIQVNLAPPDKFNEAGVPWSYFLSKIRFETVVRSNNSVVIKLTSTEALKEPFLDFLLEVSWPKGNLYREFTVLVDPPAVYKQATVPVVTAPERYQVDEHYITQQRRTSTRKTQTQLVSDGVYGPTRRNDNLWKIAEQVRRDEDVSVEQMLIALYEENPRAFYQANVNALSAGKRLKIPDKEVILKLSRTQALAELSRQTNAWKNRLASSPVEKTPAEEESPTNQLTLDAPAEAVVAENTVIAPGNEQASGGNEKTGQATQTTSEPGSNFADNAVQTKIAALEKQVAAMQQLIALKDQQLATLQNQAQTKPAVQDQPAAQPESVTPENQSVPAVPPVIQEPAVKSEPAAQEPAVKSEPVVQEPPVKSGPAAQDQAVAPAPALQEQPAPPTPSPTAAVKHLPSATPSVQPAVQPAESSTDVYYPIVGSIGAAVLSLMGWLWWRKRKIEEETNTESMFASSGVSKAYGSGLAATDSLMSNVNPPSTESSFLSEFTATDFDSFDIDQGEIDPIAEADVYLAYGRYQQAEELIRHAANDSPARDDCKLKLLEIFHATQNKKAFETYANELAEAGKKDDLPFWAKVAEMADEICPDSSLFASPTANFRADMQSSASSADAAVNLVKRDAPKEERSAIKDAEIQGAIYPDFKQGTESQQDDEVNFDLTSFTTNDDIVSDDQKNNSSLDFDIDLSSFSAGSVAGEETDDLASFAKDRVLDFDVNFPEDAAEFEETDESTTTNRLSKNVKTDTNDENLDTEDDFESFDFSFDEPFGLNEKRSKTADDDAQFSFDLDLSSEEPTEQTNDFGVSDLTDMDELETKLDLARAYIDMGDPDSAKDIVKEVLERGNVEQQKMAQTLLVDLK